ncbi:unnamed protein product [Cuscuta campestris]|uniref:Uncharacterized protein n=1 Tax=Cuscuta campestris TaxID=132261 RepID=A0A484NNN0_9ASTE|nr:unnamed protein product [Cuscuta campestris]
MQVENVLYHKDLYQTLSGENLEKMSDIDWTIFDRKALGVVRLSLAKSVFFNIVNGTTRHGIMKAFPNMYDKPSTLKNVFSIKHPSSMFVSEAMRVMDMSQSKMAKKENETRVMTDELKLCGSFNGPLDN